MIAQGHKNNIMPLSSKMYSNDFFGKIESWGISWDVSRGLDFFYP
jgi:hypothetical protein